MRWSKIKNIILLLLVIVNLLLLALVGYRAWNSKQGRREIRERMIAVLEQNHIEYLPQDLPDDLPLSGVRLTLSPLNEEQAAVLVGTVTDVQATGSRTLYTGSEGSVTVSSAGELTVEFLPQAGLSETAVLERLSALGVTLRRSDRPQAQESADASYLQLWNGSPIPGETVRLTFRDGAAHTLALRLLAGTAESAGTSADSLDAATALARFLEELNRGGYVCSQITALYPGYLSSGSSPVTLTPAWFVETDASPWRFAVDGATGAVSAVE